jgi:hypothetical protein
VWLLPKTGHGLEQGRKEAPLQITAPLRCFDFRKRIALVLPHSEKRGHGSGHIGHLRGCGSGGIGSTGGSCPTPVRVDRAEA